MEKLERVKYKWYTQKPIKITSNLQRINFEQFIKTTKEHENSLMSFEIIQRA